MSAALTTLEKAALCDALLPLVRIAAETLRPLASLAHPPDPGAQALRLSRLALEGTQSLIADEPPPLAGQLALLPPHLGSACNAADLLVTLRAIEAALVAFRLRYFGWHPSFRRTAWFIAGENGVEAAEALLPRAETAPPPGTPNADMMRSKIAARIDEILEERDTAREEARTLRAELASLRTNAPQPVETPHQH